MLIVITILWWALIIGAYNTVLRKRGFTYGKTPFKSALFYLLSTVLTFLFFAPMSFTWSFFDPLHASILLLILCVIALVDLNTAQQYEEKDRTQVRNSILVKYTDILFQQLMIFLIFLSIVYAFEAAPAQIIVFAFIFVLLHTPVFFVMPRMVAWTFFLASICGGLLFPLFFIYMPMIGPFIAFSLHVLFYSTLRKYEHDSDAWVSFIKKD